MKQLLLLIAVIISLTGCNDTKIAGSNETADHKTSAEQNAEITRQILRALETGDGRRLDSLFTEDIIDHNAGPEGQDIVGKDSVIAVIEASHGYYANLKVELLHYATSNDGQYHYATMKFSGNVKADSSTVSAGAIEDVVVDVCKIKNGKISERWSFISMKDLHETLREINASQKTSREVKK